MMKRVWLGWLFVLLLGAFSVHAADGAPRVSEGDWKAIRGVVATQLKALQADDGEAAFAQASPAIRKQFGTADVFLSMVKSAYYPLYRPRSTEFLAHAVIDGQVIQPLQVVAEDGTVVVALFTMVKGTDKRWKINGCKIAPSKLEST